MTADNRPYPNVEILKPRLKATIPYFNKYGDKGERNMWSSFESYKAGDPPVLIMDKKTPEKTVKAAQSANYKRNLKMKALTNNDSFNPKEDEKTKTSSQKSTAKKKTSSLHQKG